MGSKLFRNFLFAGFGVLGLGLLLSYAMANDGMGVFECAASACVKMAFWIRLSVATVTALIFWAGSRVCEQPGHQRALRWFAALSFVIVFWGSILTLIPQIAGDL